MDGLGGYPDGPDGRWQRYSDRFAEPVDRGAERSGERGFDGGFDRDLDRDGEPGRRSAERGDQRRDVERRERRVDAREDDNFRVPEPRFADTGSSRYSELADLAAPREDPLFGPADRLAPERPERPTPPRDGGHREPGGRTVGPRSGVELPAAEPEQYLTEQIDRSALRRPPQPPPPPTAAPAPAPTVYRSRRPGLIILLAIGTATVQLLLLFVLVHSMFSGNFAAGGMLASIFSLTGVPFTALGIYAVVTGAPAATGAHPAQSWFRAPTAYLPIGLTLLIAAALAAG